MCHYIAAPERLETKHTVSVDSFPHRIHHEDDVCAGREIDLDLLVDIASLVTRRENLDDGIRCDNRQ